MVRFRISTFLEMPAGLQLQLGKQFLDGELMVCGHGLQDAAEQVPVFKGR
jgi:hypothetical protein